jgi:fucose 4-O-acetylase-like acetyltransferase
MEKDTYMEKDNTLNHISREAWIDNVKMVAMLFVILGHTWRIIHCPLPDWLGLFILSFNMAIGLFFILLSKKMTGVYNWFSYWGSKSLPLYMVHAFFINILYRMPIYYELYNFYYLLYAIPAMVALTFVSILVIKLFMRYELTQAYCLGEMKIK